MKHLTQEDLALIAIKQNLGNWRTVIELVEEYPQFTKASIKHLLWKRDEKPGLSSCCRLVGKKLYVNLPMFGMWLGGALPEQQ